MKILALADIHNQLKWYEWIRSRARRFDLVCLVGDLLNIHSKVHLSRQIGDARQACATVIERTRLAICSGNHDLHGALVTRNGIRLYEWTARLGDGLSYVAAGGAVLTTIPFAITREEKCVLLERGAQLRDRAMLPWLVLHHEPPGLSPTDGFNWSDPRSLIEEFFPDYWLSGHRHNFPYEHEEGYRFKVGKTCVFVPGQRVGAPFPNAIELDLRTGQSRWITSCRQPFRQSTPADKAA